MKENSTNAKKKKLLKYVLILIALVYFDDHALLAQNIPTKVWDKRFGGSGIDNLQSLITTPDGGYLLGGLSDSGAGGDKTEDSKGGDDFWIVKINADGNKVWDKTYGGSGNDLLYSIVTTPDGGYLLGGWSESGAGGDKTEDSRGDADYWVVKIDADGNKVWDRRFGGSDSDLLYSLVTTLDGGYLLGGWSGSGVGGDKTEESRGDSDYWVVKIDANGNNVWDKRFGGSGGEQLFSLLTTPDGGYLLGGVSGSRVGGDKTEDHWGRGDYWVVKIDANGNKLWDRRFGGIIDDRLRTLAATPDGGYLLGGWSNSGAGDDKTEHYKGGADYWLVKIDADGNKVWDKTYGGSGNDLLYSIVTTQDGGYLLGGVSVSSAGGDKSQYPRGESDYWLVKIDADGNKLWDKTIGGYGIDELYSLQETSDGGYILGGISKSDAGSDKTEANISPYFYDYWVVRITGTGPLGADGMEKLSKIQASIYPNPGSGNINLVVQGLESFNDVVHLAIYNSVGNAVLQQTNSARQMQVGMKLLTADLPKGIYYVQLHIKEEVITKKLLIN